MINLNDLRCVNDKVDIKEYIEFLNMVKSSTKNPKWLGDFTFSDIEKLVDESSKIWMYYLNNIKVCSIMGIPMNEKSKKELGVYLIYNKVLECGPIFVNPKYQGNGLASSMLKVFDKYATDNNYEYGLTTVDPCNENSINTFKNNDFVLVKKVNLPRGQRNVYVKKYK